MNWYTELKTSDEMQPRMIEKKIFYEKNRFCMRQIAPQARLINQNAPQAGFLD